MTLLRFTSRNIITSRWLRDNPEVKIECWSCGKLIQKFDPRQKYCSSICKKRYWRASRRNIKYNTCGWCNSQFETIRSDKVYCTRKCRDSAWRDSKGIPILGKTKDSCRECGISYVKTQSAQKYCSLRCFTISRLRNRKLAHRRQRGSKLPYYEQDEAVIASEIQEAISNIIKSGVRKTEIFDENDWSKRADAALKNILSKYG